LTPGSSPIPPEAISTPLLAGANDIKAEHNES
jgi:hypothetical protein